MNEKRSLVRHWPVMALAVVAAVLHSASSLIIIFNSARLVRAGEELQSSDTSG